MADPHDKEAGFLLCCSALFNSWHLPFDPAHSSHHTAAPDSRKQEKKWHQLSQSPLFYLYPPSQIRDHMAQPTQNENGEPEFL